MLRPLYSNLARKPLQLGTGHAGLWYDKFCDRWSDSWSMSGDGDKKLAWIKSVTERPVGLAELLTESTDRVLRLTSAAGGIFGIFVTEGRFVTGLGRSHPVENGFAWHPTLGVPYLPGSSVKGMVQAWAKRDAEPLPSDEHREVIFGSPRHVGQIMFMDAIPVAPVLLETDVITPHYAGWTTDQPPGDWCGPVPVPFLVTAPQTAFVFALLPRGGGNPLALQEVFGWLRAALEQQGAGAKTSVGYGRFRYDEPKTQSLKSKVEEERQAPIDAARRAKAMESPEGRWGLEIEGKTEQELLELVRVHLEKNPLSDPSERLAFARTVAGTGFVESWRRGDKKQSNTSTGAKKRKERARLIELLTDRDSSSDSEENA